MIRALLVLGCLSTLMIVGCQGWNLRGQDLSPFSLGRDSAAASENPSSTPEIKPGRLLITPDNTQITFLGKQGWITQPGSFQRFSGKMDLPGDRPQQGELEVQIEMDSVKTRIGLLTRHLKSDDFFDVDVFPTASFVSSRIEPAEAPSHYTLQGRLTIHGVTRTVRLPARIQVRPDEVLLEIEWIVRQTDYRMEKGAKHADDEVTITVTSSIPRKPG